MRTRRDAAGYTLIELLAYLSVFAVVVNLAGSLFVSAGRLRMMGNEALERMQALDEMGRRFTDAVHESSGVAREADGFTTSDETLVLNLPHDRYAVMGRLRGDDRFVTMKFAAGAPGTPEFLKTFSYPVEHMIYSVGARGDVTMRVRLRNDAPHGGAEHTFVAMPRSVQRGEP